ncbi:unnamed protein product [Ectocarpus sp. 12 AP-2014]
MPWFSLRYSARRSSERVLPTPEGPQRATPAGRTPDQAPPLLPPTDRRTRARSSLRAASKPGACRAQVSAQPLVACCWGRRRRRLCSPLGETGCPCHETGELRDLSCSCGLTIAISVPELIIKGRLTGDASPASSLPQEMAMTRRRTVSPRTSAARSDPSRTMHPEMRLAIARLSHLLT